LQSICRKKAAFETRNSNGVMRRIFVPADAVDTYTEAAEKKPLSRQF
jgi:hypothetical protein